MSWDKEPSKDQISKYQKWLHRVGWFGRSDEISEDEEWGNSESNDEENSEDEDEEDLESEDGDTGDEQGLESGDGDTFDNDH